MACFSLLRQFTSRTALRWVAIISIRNYFSRFLFIISSFFNFFNNRWRPPYQLGTRSLPSYNPICQQLWAQFTHFIASSISLNSIKALVALRYHFLHFISWKIVDYYWNLLLIFELLGCDHEEEQLVVLPICIITTCTPCTNVLSLFTACLSLPFYYYYNYSILLLL